MTKDSMEEEDPIVGWEIPALVFALAVLFILLAPLLASPS